MLPIYAAQQPILECASKFQSSLPAAFTFKFLRLQFISTKLSLPQVYLQQRRFLQLEAKIFDFISSSQSYSSFWFCN